jgi:hypothetical protein
MYSSFEVQIQIMNKRDIYFIGGENE